MKESEEPKKMNRADRRKAKKLRHTYENNKATWVAGSSRSPVEADPPEPAIPGVTVRPESAEFTSKVDGNVWHDREEFDAFIDTIKKQSVEDDYEWSWAYNHNCKYVDIRIDMRDGGFIVMDREGRRINLDQLKWQYRSADSEQDSETN